jgi:hypothetical protein
MRDDEQLILGNVYESLAGSTSYFMVDMRQSTPDGSRYQWGSQRGSVLWNYFMSMTMMFADRNDQGDIYTFTYWDYGTYHYCEFLRIATNVAGGSNPVQYLYYLPKQEYLFKSAVQSVFGDNPWYYVTCLAYTASRPVGAYTYYSLSLMFVSVYKPNRYVGHYLNLYDPSYQALTDAFIAAEVHQTDWYHVEVLTF